MNKKMFSLCYIACLALYLGIIAVIILSHGGRAKVRDDEVPQNVSAPLLYAESVGEKPHISAKSAALIDAKSGAVLFEKDSSAHLPMASTTKIMTAYVILTNMDIDEVVKVPKEATLVEGSSIYLRDGEEIKVETLLYGLMLESGNDAAVALAVACSGSVDEFAALMNRTAHEMGMCDTVFANPHGLSAENHYTTAYELAYITSKAMQIDKFREIVSTQKMLVPSLDGSSTRLFLNHNKLLKYYDGAVGVKTGFTKNAGRCLVSAAERDGDMFIAVTLNDGNDWSDHQSMLDYAFNCYDTVSVAKKGEFSVYKNGERLSNADDVYITVPKGLEPVFSYNADASEKTGVVRYCTGGAEIGKFYISREAAGVEE